MKKYLWSFALSAVMLAACGKKEEAPAPVASAPVAVAAAPENTEEKVLNIYNWPDYIPDGMIAAFEKETGIKVNYDTFETNEALNAKLVAGNTGYDIVVPGTSFSPAQTEAGFFQELDRSKLKNYGNLDPVVMEGLAKADPGNKHLVPWGWGYTTVAINRDKVTKALGGAQLPENAWDLVFNPSYTAKLKSCGIAYLDSPTEVIPPALHYIGKDAYSNDPADHKAAAEMLAKVRKNIRIFSATMIDDVAGGKACVALGWSGDLNMASKRVKDNGSKDVIEVLIPKSGGLLFFDTMAITKGAKHPNNAYAFMDFYMRGENGAKVSDEMSYPTGNKAAIEKMNPETAANKTVFLEDAVFKTMVIPGKFTNEGRESMANAFNAFKKGN